MAFVQLATVETVLSQTAMSSGPGTTPPTHRVPTFNAPDWFARLISAASLIWANKAAIAERPKEGKTVKSFVRIPVSVGLRLARLYRPLDFRARLFLKLEERIAARKSLRSPPAAPIFSSCKRCQPLPIEKQTLEAAIFHRQGKHVRS